MVEWYEYNKIVLPPRGCSLLRLLPFTIITQTRDISRSNITRYWTQYEGKKTKTLFRLLSHTRHPIAGHNRRSLFVSFMNYIEKVAVTYRKRIVLHSPNIYPADVTSLGYLLIYPPQIATVMKPISFSSKYSPVSHTKSLGESREWNMVFQGNIRYRLKAS